MKEGSISSKTERKATYSRSCVSFVCIIKGSSFLRLHNGIMGTIEEYYIVPKPVYDTCYNREESLHEKIAKLPKSSQIKVKKLLHFLPENIKNENLLDLAGFSYTLFDYVNYATRGKNKPSDWESFLVNLATAPQSVFCAKVKTEVKKYKRKNGTKIH